MTSDPGSPAWVSTNTQEVLRSLLSTYVTDATVTTVGPGRHWPTREPATGRPSAATGASRRRPAGQSSSIGLEVKLSGPMRLLELLLTRLYESRNTKPPELAFRGNAGPLRRYTGLMPLHGVCTIALTPFTEDGDLDQESIDSLAEFYLESGVHGVTILGIMGEAHKLSDAERQAVTQRYLSAVGGRVPLVVGCSGAATRVAAQMARAAEEAGAAAVMVAPPNNQRSLDLVFEHYRRVAEDVSVPVVVQDEPVNTGVVMPAPFIARLVDEIRGCCYVKLEEAPTTIKISSLLKSAKTKAGVFGGLGGMYFYEELVRGAVGIMTGFAYPHVLVETYRLFAADQKREAQEYFFRYLPLIRFEAQLGVGGVGIRKEILKLRGVISSSHVRFPAPALDEETLRELEDLVEVLELAD